MASFEEGLFQYLTSQSSLTNLINTRLFPDIIPLNTVKPYISYRIISEVEKQTVVAGNFGMIEKHIEFSIQADSRSEVYNIHDTLITLLKNYSNIDFYGYHLQCCTFQYSLTEFDDYQYIQISEYKFMYTKNS